MGVTFRIYPKKGKSKHKTLKLNKCIIEALNFNIALKPLFWVYAVSGSCFSNQSKMSKEVENLKQALELAKSKLQVAEKALNDIVKWDDDLEDEWGDPGERANSALEKIMILDGF